MQQLDGVRVAELAWGEPAPDLSLNGEVAQFGADAVADHARLNDEGRINPMRHYVDTAKQIKTHGLE